MSKKVTVDGLEGEWRLVVDINTTDQPRYLVENTDNGMLLITEILNGDYSRVAGPFTAQEAFQGAVDILSGRTPLGSVTAAMQSIAAGLMWFLADYDLNQQKKLKTKPKIRKKHDQKT